MRNADLKTGTAHLNSERGSRDGDEPHQQQQQQPKLKDSMQHRIIFDIETGPLPTATLEKLLPPFDAAEVKLGNLKDPDKIREKIQQAEKNHLGDFINTAALSPITGQVLAIGFKVDDMPTRIIVATPGTEIEMESEVIAAFWRLYHDAKDDGYKCHPQMIGFNSNRFDLPFLIRRSWALRMHWPYELRNGRYWSPNCIDLREIWQLGDHQAGGSLDAICRTLGLGQKNGNGALFYKTLAEDREAALAYARNDVEMTARLAERLMLTF